jgi:7-cyano-7-deazaguanine synthase
MRSATRASLRTLRCVRASVSHCYCKRAKDVTRSGMSESAPVTECAGRAVVLLSGGLDSAACSHLLQQAGWSVQGLFLAYGQAAATSERAAARRVAAHLGIDLLELEITGGTRFEAGELTGRNAFFVFTALLAGRIVQGGIVLGIHAGTPYYDCSPAFVKMTDQLVAEHTDGRMRLLAPLINWTKSDVLAYCRRTGIPMEITYSCEAGTVPPCGVCASCRDRTALEC